MQMTRSRPKTGQPSSTTTPSSSTPSSITPTPQAMGSLIQHTTASIRWRHRPRSFSRSTPPQAAAVTPAPQAQAAAPTRRAPRPNFRAWACRTPLLCSITTAAASCRHPSRWERQQRRRDRSRRGTAAATSHMWGHRQWLPGPCLRLVLLRRYRRDYLVGHIARWRSSTVAAMPATARGNPGGTVAGFRVAPSWPSKEDEHRVISGGP